jgi:hypothetical protein
MLELPDVDHIGAIVLAAGALGTAAFGIVEGLKRWKPLGEAGFPVVLELLNPIFVTLHAAYGPDVDKVLRAQYRGERSELTRVIRQGARIGLKPENAEAVATSLGIVQAADLKAATEQIEVGRELSAEHRNVIGRYELAVDARIDAALCLAIDEYATVAKITASAIALAIALAVGLTVGQPFQALLVGIAAVPLAPIAKDVATALRSAADALRQRT